MENKPLYKKIPWWGWIIIVILTLGSIGSITAFNKTKQKAQIQEQAGSPKQKSISDETEQKVEKLRADMAENLNESVGNIFTKSYLEHITDNAFKLELTVNDEWYYLKEFQQERLLEDAWRFFNSLGVKYSLRNKDDLPWKVTFVDRYDKKVAEKGW